MGHVFSTVDGSDGSSSNDVYVMSAAGVKDYAPAGADPISAALSGIQLMMFPIDIGAVYPQVDVTVDSGIDLDGDGRSDKVRVRATLTVVGIESLSTPVGTFDSALHQHELIVETIIPSSGRASVDVNIDVDSWYGDGVGLVKSITNVTAAGTLTTSTEILTGYRVGLVTSDTVAPTVQSVLPATGVVRGINTTVSATFSEPIDARSANAAAFTVTDGGDVAILGTTQVAGSSVTFAPTQPWVSGTYTAHVTTDIKDLLGNALATDRTWTFTVDATGLGIASITPAAGVKDVAVATPVVIVFSEAPDPSTINATNVRLSAGGTDVSASRSLAANTLTLTPNAPLDQATLYTLTVLGVTDLVGNPMANTVLQQFQTTQGRFAYPVDITFPPIGGIVVMAIGDVNGDGIADVLLATTGTGTPANDGLYVLQGRTDGTLAPAVKVNIGTQMSCFITSIAIGDLNGDGRPDVAVGGNYCGVQVLHQAADSSLVVAEYLNRVSSDVIRIADVDRSGKNALIGVGGGLSSVTIWRQDSTGTLTLSQSLAIGSGFGRDVEIGDVNGDGLPDIVVAQQSGGTGQDITVLLQQPGNTFAAPTYLSTGLVSGAGAIAIGDLNGDGRQDVVASTGGNSPTSIAVFYQDASGALGPATQVATYDSPLAVRVADIDGDGRADIVVSHVGWNAVGIYLQQPNGTLAPEARYSAPYGSFMPQQMAVGDIDRDGRPDIVIAGAIIRQLPGTAGSMAVVARSKMAHQAAVHVLTRPSLSSGVR